MVTDQPENEKKKNTWNQDVGERLGRGGDQKERVVAQLLQVQSVNDTENLLPVLDPRDSRGQVLCVVCRLVPRVFAKQQHLCKRHGVTPVDAMRCGCARKGQPQCVCLSKKTVPVQHPHPSPFPHTQTHTQRPTDTHARTHTHTHTETHRHTHTSASLYTRAFLHVQAPFPSICSRTCCKWPAHSFA